MADATPERQYNLQPVTAGLIVILERIESPLLDLIRSIKGANTAQEAQDSLSKFNPDPERIIQTVFCFLKPGAEVRALLARGREVFAEVAMEEVGFKFHPYEFAQLQQAIGEHFAKSALAMMPANLEANKGCDHKFVVRKSCLKCGWTPPEDAKL